MRARSDSGARVHTQFTDGDVLDKVEVDNGGAFVAAKYLVSDTRLQVQLPTALAAKGGHIRLRIAYHYTVPGAFGGRTQFLDTPNGMIYEIAQWYPRMAVYDDRQRAGPRAPSSISNTARSPRSPIERMPRVAGSGGS